MGYIGADPALNESVTAAQIVDGTIVAADVASNAITNAKMADDAVGVAELSASGTASSSTFLRGDNAWTALGTASTRAAEDTLTDGANLPDGAAVKAYGDSNWSNDVTHASLWRISTTFAGDANPVTTNWVEASDPDAYGRLGTGMSESSGVFTFPTTGFWYVECFASHEFNSTQTYAYIVLAGTGNNSSYAGVSLAFTSAHVGGYGSPYCSAVIDVTNTSNVKVNMRVHQGHSSNTTLGDSGDSRTGMNFYRLADT